MSKFFNISTDSTLGGNSPSDVTVSSQKAIKTYVDSQTGTAPAFANIVGQPSDNANLATALNAKYDASNPNGYTSNVGTVTSVNNTSPDGSGNVTLSIPAAQIQSDWTQADNTKLDYIKNKPSLATVATSGSYNDLSNKPTIPTVNNATLTITQGGTTKGTFTANASSDVTIALDAGGGSSRKVGEIVQTTVPLTDAGLHLLDGSLINGSGSYADFVTYIAGLVSNYPDIFETEANWQSAVTTYGVCGKFVYDSVNNTVRLPKITGFTEGTIDTTVLGDLVEAGLPNITGYAGFTDDNNTAFGIRSVNATGAFYTKSRSRSPFSSNSTSSATIAEGGYFDASRSNSIYGNSSTVQPQAIKVLYYIVVANSTKTQIEVDIDEVMTDLNGKADVDLTNVNSSGTSLASGWAMPSTRYDDITLGANGATYTAPANGYFTICKISSGSSQELALETSHYVTNGALSSGNSQWLKASVPVKKGDTVACYYTVGGNTSWFRFVYAEGN